MTAQGYYPAFLDLHGRTVVVIGGGEVALRKIKSLLSAGASVRVVAPQVHVEIEGLETGSAVTVVRRPYRYGDLKEAIIAIAATSDPEVNRIVSDEAAERNILLNVVDAPDLSSFIAPSVIRRDDLTVAISTGGLSPALAKHIREKLEETVVPEYGGFLRLLGGMRSSVRRDLPLLEQREMFWTEVVNSNAFDVYRTAGDGAAKARIEEILRRVREGNQRGSGHGG
jgi:precorrin-2 dehydrogenase / sirohydrochlorin ferrochelatase